MTSFHFLPYDVLPSGHGSSPFVTAVLNANYIPDVSLISWCCQFRALSDQFYQTPEHHEFVTQQVVNQVGLSLKIIKFGFLFCWACVIVFHWNHRALHTNLMFNVSCCHNGFPSRLGRSQKLMESPPIFSVRVWSVIRDTCF